MQALREGGSARHASTVLPVRSLVLFIAFLCSSVHGCQSNSKILSSLMTIDSQHAASLYDLPLEQRNIGRFLRLRATEDADRPYLTIAETTYTFGETAKRCRDLARGLAQRGIRDGSRVLLVLPNCAEFIFTWYACSLLGAAIVPLNTESQRLPARGAGRGRAADAVSSRTSCCLRSIRCGPKFRRMVPWLAVVGAVDARGAQRIVTDVVRVRRALRERRRRSGSRARLPPHPGDLVHLRHDGTARRACMIPGRAVVFLGVRVHAPLAA